MTDVIRVMLCDDSAVMRRLLKTALKSDSRIEVVCEAKHGQDALDKLSAGRPDVVVMDVEMPVMDGIDAVRAIRRRSKSLPVIMFSSLTSRGAEATLDAIAAGATDFATKPANAGHIAEAMSHVRDGLIPKIRHWTGTAPPLPPTPGPVLPESPPPTKSAASPRSEKSREGTIAAVAIGVSTGGPQALNCILAELPRGFSAPVVIAQHMPPVFTALLAERLAAQTGHPVREACEGEEVKAGEILLAPGDYHLTVVREGTAVIARLKQSEPENSCRPSVDPLFRSVADCYGHKALGVILTGMGKDGEAGARMMRSRGAKIIVQDEATSVVWGMPGNAVKCGLADRVFPLGQIANEIIRVAPVKAAALA